MDIPDFGDDELEPSTDPTEQNETAEDQQAEGEPTQSAQVRPMEDHPELQNLAETLGEEKLQEIGALVFAEYTEDEASRQQWIRQQEIYIKLAAQIDRPMNPPWQGSSSESLPILAEANNQFHARAIKSFFPSQKIIKGVPIGHVTPDDEDRAERIGNHMSWQLMVQDKSYYRNKDRLFGSVALHGSMFTKTFRDPLKQRNVVENVRALDFVAPYGTGPRDVEDLPRKTQIIFLDLTKANWLFRNGFFSAMPEVYSDNNTEQSAQGAIDEVGGQQPMNQGTQLQAKILEQHRSLDLDGDDLEEPYIVWVCAATQQVLRIAIRWEVHAEDQLLKDHNGQPVIGPDGQPIVTAQKGDPKNYKEPVEYFTHYPYLENPDGFYALGMGYLIGNPNTAINKILRQIIDAGTMANSDTGFVDEKLNLKKGPIEIEIGRLNPIRGSVDDIKKSIFMLEHKGPNEGLVNTMKMLKEAADRLAGSTEVLTGAPDKVMQPTTVAALIEQGLMAYTAVQNRLHNAWEQELTKLYRLNSIYLDDQEYYAINDLTGMVSGQIAKSDYAGDMQVRPAVDPNQATTQQKISLAEAEYKVLAASPIVQSDPVRRWYAEMRYLKAIGSTDIDQALGPKPQPTPPPPDPDIVKLKMELDSKERMKRAELEAQMEVERIRAQAGIEEAKLKASQFAQPVPPDPGFPMNITGYDIPDASFQPSILGQTNGQQAQPGMGANGSGGMGQPPNQPPLPSGPPQ